MNGLSLEIILSGIIFVSLLGIVMIALIFQRRRATKIRASRHRKT